MNAEKYEVHQDRLRVTIDKAAINKGCRMITSSPHTLVDEEFPLRSYFRLHGGEFSVRDLPQLIAGLQVLQKETEIKA